MEKDKKDGKYIIVDLRTMNYMKDKNGEIVYYNTEREAFNACGIYEVENAWIMKLIYNHIELK